MNLFWRLFPFCCLLLLMAACVLSAALAEDAVPSSFRCLAEVREKQVSVYAEPGKKASVLAKASKGDSFEVIGEENGFYKVAFQDRAGYVSQKQVNLTAAVPDEPLPENLCPAVSLLDPIPDRHEKYLTLQGTLENDNALDALFLLVWDDRLNRAETIRVWAPAEPASSVDMEVFARAMPLNKLTGGRKTIVLEGVSGGSAAVFFRSPAYVCKLDGNEEVPHVTAQCKGLPGTLTDTKWSSAWAPTNKAPELRIKIPAEANVSLVTLEWKVPPETFTVDLLDENGAAVSRLERATGFYMDSVSVDSSVREFVLAFPAGKGALATFRAYAEPFSHHAVQQWEPIPDKIDILFVSTHQDDEILFFGGAIPHYSHLDGVNIAVVYMADCGRTRYREALDGLWTCGLKYHPVFLGLKDKQLYNTDLARRLWEPDHPIESLAEIIRRYRPEVVVVQDFNGEYGHAQHKWTALLTAESVKYAADKEKDCRGEPWQVKKLYVHLYEKDQIHMDWTRPLDETGVITPWFLAAEAYDKHRSQQAYFSMRRQGVQYDNTCFGLYYTAVGPDEEKNDFLEHIR